MARVLKSRIAIIGGGPAGCMCGYFLQNDCEVVIFEAKSPLATLLPTGGGRCNLAYCEYDFKELAMNYPRGEKFLYSLFSKFSTAETLEFFQKIGVDTYVQDDLRIFPISNSAVNVRDKFLKSLSHVKFIKEKVCSVACDSGKFTINTDRTMYLFDKMVIAVGGHAGFLLPKLLGHNIIQPKPALAGLNMVEKFTILSGVAVKNVTAQFDSKVLTGDIMFTHTGITGPLIYKISSIMAREKFPYKISLDFAGNLDLQSVLNSNPHKSIKNILACELSNPLPKALTEFLLVKLSINPEIKAHNIDGKTRDLILSILNNFEITVSGTRSDGEVVTSGGVDLKEINPKTMESKLVPGLYYCGEVIDVDGFCGGFNLQNCWSTGYCAAHGVLESIKK